MGPMLNKGRGQQKGHKDDPDLAFVKQGLSDNQDKTDKRYVEKDTQKTICYTQMW